MSTTYTTKHTPGAYLIIGPDGAVAERVTYDRDAGFEAKREAYQFAFERCAALTARAAAALVASVNALVAYEVSSARGYEPDAEELAEFYAWVDELERETTTTTPAQPVAATGEIASSQAARELPAPELVRHAGPVTPTPAQLDAALARRQAEAERAVEYSRADGDVEGVKIARRSAQAYRDARAIAADNGYRVTANGDLLVKSRSRSAWHVVARQPANGSGYSPIPCSCEWNQKAHTWGPCAHVGFFEGYADAVELTVAERDDAAALAA
jgi:hypothetical protein